VVCSCLCNIVIIEYNYFASFCNIYYIEDEIEDQPSFIYVFFYYFSVIICSIYVLFGY